MFSVSPNNNNLTELGPFNVFFLVDKSCILCWQNLFQVRNVNKHSLGNKIPHLKKPQCFSELVNIFTVLPRSLNGCWAPLTEHRKSLSKHFT